MKNIFQTGLILALFARSAFIPSVHADDQETADAGMMRVTFVNDAGARKLAAIGTPTGETVTRTLLGREFQYEIVRVNADWTCEVRRKDAMSGFMFSLGGVLPDVECHGTVRAEKSE